MRLRRRHHAHVFEGVNGAGPAVTAVPFRAKSGECKETKKMVLIMLEKDKRRSREIMKRERGGRKLVKNDEQFAFVLARKTRVETESNGNEGDETTRQHEACHE